MYSWNGNGSPSHCCRCTSREPGDPVEGDAVCSSTWTSASRCDPDGCKQKNGMFSEVFGNPHCCNCDYLRSRRLSIFDIFRDVIVNGCFSLFGTGMGGLSTAADIIDAAGYRAIHGFMKGLGVYSCNNRAGILADVLYKDNRCLIKYTDAMDIIVEGCDIIPQCGLTGYPVRSRANKQPTTPMTYYLKNDGICQQRRWDDGFSGELKWCG
jgi:hypothetical protein